VFNPPTRSVRVIRPSAPGLELASTDTLVGEEVVPGFWLPVASFFEMPPTAAR
jgi:hypothetical protein